MNAVVVVPILVPNSLSNLTLNGQWI